jgi:hypothetical protein
MSEGQFGDKSLEVLLCDDEWKAGVERISAQVMYNLEVEP